VPAEGWGRQVDKADREASGHEHTLSKKMYMLLAVV
jgi:hypothetical protein